MTTVLLLSTDLMFSSSLAGAAERAGCRFQTADHPEQLLEKLAAAPEAIVLIDLGKTPNVGDVVPRLRASAASPRAILAYGPHVHVERLKAARAAGCDEVLTRGQLHSGAAEVLAAYVTR